MDIDNCSNWDVARWEAEYDKWVAEWGYTDEARATWIEYRNLLFLKYNTVDKGDGI